MGLILDLAVAALALVVIGSLATLAWTLAVSAVRASRQGEATLATLRRSVRRLADGELADAARRVDAALVEGIRHTATLGRGSTATVSSSPRQPVLPANDITARHEPEA